MHRGVHTSSLAQTRRRARKQCVWHCCGCAHLAAGEGALPAAITKPLGSDLKSMPGLSSSTLRLVRRFFSCKGQGRGADNGSAQVE